MNPEIKAKVLESIVNTPLLSQCAARLIELCGREKRTLQDIKNIVEQDSVLTAKILKTVNSAAYSLSQEVTSIDRAIPYLGERIILTIAIESSAGDVFNKTMAGYMSKDGELWKHSVKVAIASKELAEFTKENVDKGTAYTCGLMHDIGKSVISSYLSTRVEKLSQKVLEKSDSDYLSIEEEYLSINHCEAGSVLANHWKLPKIFASVAAFHHHPSLAPEESRTMCFVVHIADIMAMMSGAGTGIDSLHYAPDKDFLNYLEITELDFQKIMLKVEDEFGRMISNNGE